MKIIRPVEQGGKWIVGKKFRCDGCGKVLEAEADDVMFTYKRPGESVINFIPCPACDTAVHIGIAFMLDGYGKRRSDDRG